MRCNLAKFEKILYMGSRATLNFRKFKVALNPMYVSLTSILKEVIFISRRVLKEKIKTGYVRYLQVNALEE